jgi:hypothetical protein
VGALTREVKYRRHYDNGQIKNGLFFNNFSTKMLIKNSNFRACRILSVIVNNLLITNVFLEAASHGSYDQDTRPKDAAIKTTGRS